MEEHIVHPAKHKKDYSKDDNYGYSLEDWDRSLPNCVLRVCECGCREFRVYSNFGNYETWVECTKCGGVQVVHDG